jgi:hypothetical protein
MPDNEDTTTRIEKLERDLAALTTRVVALEPHPGGSPNPQPATGSPSIVAEVVADDGPFGEVRITGNGFSGGETVTLTIKSVTRSPSGQQNTEVGTIDMTASPEGELDDSIGVSCPMGATTTHTIRARGASSGRLTHAVTVSC